MSCCEGWTKGTYEDGGKIGWGTGPGLFSGDKHVTICIMDNNCKANASWQMTVRCYDSVVE